jgi:hypothetical protein
VQRSSDFVESREYLKHVTAKTPDWYATSFNAFGASIPRTLAAKNSLLAFGTQLRESGVSPISRNTYWHAIGACLCLHEKGQAETLLRIPRLRDRTESDCPCLAPADVRKFIQYRPRPFAPRRLWARRPKIEVEVATGAALITVRRMPPWLDGTSKVRKNGSERGVVGGYALREPQAAESEPMDSVV